MVEPCDLCHVADENRPDRVNGSGVEYKGRLCLRCYRRLYSRIYSRRKDAAPQKEKERVQDNRPFVEDPAKHLGLIHLIAFKFNGAMEYDEMVGYGQIALLNACRSYDPTRERKFSTYATRVIQNAILNAIDSKDLIRVPASAADKTRKPVIMREHECPVPLGAMLYAPNSEPEGLAEKQKQATRLLELLPDSESNVLRLRFGIGCAEHSLSEIGRVRSFTKERARQLLNRGIERIRQQLEVPA